MGNSSRRAALFINLRARRGEELFQPARELLTGLGLDVSDARGFRSTVEMQDAVEEQIDEGAPLVVVGGGDGTFSSVARFFAHTDSVLGVLPLGTGNAFARDLGISSDLDSACDAIVNGKVANVDMGSVGDRQFLNVATLGLTTLIAEEMPGNLKKVLGKAVYVFSVLRALSKVEPFLVKLQLPDRLESFECLQLVIGNGRFHAGPFPIAPDARITGGHLAVYALATRDKRAFLKMAMHMVNGHHVDLCEVKYFRTKSGTVHTAPSQEMIVDGEICSRTPQEFRISEGALKVMAPQSFSG